MTHTNTGRALLSIVGFVFAIFGCIWVEHKRDRRCEDDEYDDYLHAVR
jgi:hypothetical protein